ncbi:ribonuclease H-like domain-containing protein [Tanacetum coccineum]
MIDPVNVLPVNLTIVQDLLKLPLNILLIFESEISRVPQEVYVSKPITTNENRGRSLVSSAVYYEVTPQVLGGNSRVDEMILARVLSDFAGEKYGSKTGCWLVLVLAGRLGKGLYKLGCDRGRLKMIKGSSTEEHGDLLPLEIGKATYLVKEKIRVGNLDFDSVSFVKELGHFNLFSISQICDKQHKVLFTETECLVVSSNFKMPDENQILLKVPRHHNMYSFDMKTPTPAKGFACLIAKATSDESKLWHRRLGHINFKNLNKLVKGNLVRGLPSKVFRNDHTCVAYHKDTLSVLGKFDGKSDEGFLVGYSLNSKAFSMFDIDYLTDSMNYIPVSLENQTNPHAGTSEVTNSAGTLQTPNANVFEEEDEAEELIVVPTTLKHTAATIGPRKSSTNSKAEEFLPELQNLKVQEKEAYSTGISEDTHELLAFRRELDKLAQKHLREVPKNKGTITNSVNFGSGQDNTQHADQDDSDMP